MATPAKDYPIKWVEEKKDKKQVAVMFPNASYHGHSKLNEITRGPFQEIKDPGVFEKHAKLDPCEFSKHKETLIDLKRHSERIEVLVKEFTQELTATNRLLRQEIAGRIQAEKSLEESEKRFRSILENSYDVIYRANLCENTFDYITPSSKRVFGYDPEELKSLDFKELRTLVHPDDRDRFKKHFNIFRARSPAEIDSFIEHRVKHKTLGYRWISHNHTLLFDDAQNPVAVVGNVRDIHRRKQAELGLQGLHDALALKVKERSVRLEEANAALKLMLEREKEIRAEVENRTICNVNELALPFVQKLKMTQLDNRQRSYLNILESNLNSIVSPFLYSLTSKFMELTPGEIKVASLIKYGNETKEIADLLNVSDRTVEFYRASIRKKLGIKHKKVNLRSYLLSLCR